MKRMPSKPLFGMPVVVGMSAAVMAMRSVVSAEAAWAASIDDARTPARHQTLIISHPRLV